MKHFILIIILILSADIAAATDSQPALLVQPDVQPAAGSELIQECADDWTPPPGLDRHVTAPRGWNEVYLTVAPEAGAESSAEHVALFFQERPIWLGGRPDGFPAGFTMYYDLAPVSSFLQSLPIDYWDDITLATDCGDALTVSALKIKHNGQWILDWHGRQTLVSPAASRWNLSMSILASKLAVCPASPNGIAYWAFTELGKDDGEKYSDEHPGGWCSEFSAWVLRRNGWNTPAGAIASHNMRAFFDERDRLYDISQIYAGEYVCGMGDYVSMHNGGHSGLFLSYIDSSSGPLPSTRVYTIEGGGAIRVYIRTLNEFDHIGSAQ